MNIRKLDVSEDTPIDFLLLADPSKNHIEDYIKRGDCFVAEIDQHIIGVYVMLPTRPQTVELVNVAVVEKQQGKGIGKKLVVHAIQTAKKSGYRTMEIGTGNSSIGQLALYQKCGFRITSVDIDFFIRNYSEKIVENGIHCRDMIRMSLDL